MKKRSPVSFVMSFAIPCAAVLVATAFSQCKRHLPAEAPPSPSGALTLAAPEQGCYTGAYIDFGELEDNVTLEQIEDFEAMVGKRQAIIASSSYWGEQTFPKTNVNIVWRHGAVPLVFWSPWDRPYAEDRGPDQYSLTSIIDGKWDAYIDRWGDGAREFGRPLMVSFCNEMNGSWFPWSGCFYGGSTPAADGQGFAGPETFKKAYRHVVDRVRARGAWNVIWVFHAMNYSIPQDTWNLAEQYYPGSRYVDWLGLSVYGEQYAEENWSPFTPLLEWPYDEICQLDPQKPVMLTEWGVGEFPTKGNKAEYIAEAFKTMTQAGRYPRLKAAIFWHERWQNDDASYSNLRVNSTPESLAAYRAGVKEPFWLEAPVFHPAGGQ